MKAGYPGHDSMREKAERAFGSAEMRGYDKPERPSDCYKHGGKTHHGRVKKDIGGALSGVGKSLLGMPLFGQIGGAFKHGGKVHHNRVKKDIGGEIQKAGAMGLPAYFSSKVAGGFKRGGKTHHGRTKRDIGGALSGVGKSLLGMPLMNQIGNAFKHGGKTHKPVKRNMGGPMVSTADNIQMANQLLSNAASNGTGLKRGGHAHHKHSARHRRADGGTMNEIGEREFNVGRKAAGFNEGGKLRSGGRTGHYDMGGEIKRETGGEVKRAIGGAGKIRHGQMTRRGAQIAPRARFKG